MKFDWIRNRVCSIDGSAAPAYFGCKDEHTYSPSPSTSPTTDEDKLEVSIRQKALAMIGLGPVKAIEVPTIKVALEIDLDIYASETGWTLAEWNTNIPVKRVRFKDYRYENQIKEVFDLKMGEAYMFTISDQYGDGITNKGKYRVYVVDPTKPDSVGTILLERKGDFGVGRSDVFTVPTIGAIKRQRTATERNRIGLLRNGGILRNGIP
jgi:hypothetical protein